MEELKIISPADARAIGLTRYFTGKPCKCGHIAERLVSNAHCVSCEYSRDRAASHRAYHLRNRESILERHASSETKLENARAWRAANVEKSRGYTRVYRDKKYSAEVLAGLNRGKS